MRTTDAFGESGFVRVDQAFSPGDAKAMCDVMWGIFAREFGIEQSDPSTWNRPFKKRPLVEAGSLLQFDGLLTDRVATVIDDVLGEGSWQWPADWGEFLITFPNASSWSLPAAGWHQDWGFETNCEPVPMFKAFAFLNRVDVGGGGTLVVHGSHRLAGLYGGGRVADENGRTVGGSDRLYRECDWLRDLTTPGDDAARRRRFMDEATDTHGVRLQVVELTGQPGDVVIVHPWLIHAIAPNASAGPRFMRATVYASRTVATSGTLAAR